MELTGNQPADDNQENGYTKLRRRFYEQLLLLRILEPTQGTHAPQLAVDSSSRGQERLWRKLLDGLAWLCDHECGGDTVSAVAVEDRPSGLVFWLATSSEASSSHLQWVLDELKRAFGCSAAEQAMAVDRITEKCIEFSCAKAKNYAQRLCQSLHPIIQEDSDELSGTSTQSFETFFNDDMSEHPRASLKEALQNLLELNNSQDFLQLCDRSYSLEECFCSASLGQVMPGFEENYEWQQARHYIGRLGSWKRTITILVRLCSAYPHLVRDSSVQTIYLPPARVPPPAGGQSKLVDAVGRMFPGNEPEQWHDLAQVLGASRVLNIREEYKNKYEDKNFKPRVHAETLLLEHFYQNDLDFAGNERYIGCSKASCYCCALYMRYHPGNFPLRSSHGNVWCNWEPPFGMCKEPKERYKHTEGILNDMVAYMRRDIVRLTKSKLTRKKRQPDSSTNITDHLILDDADSRAGDRIL